MEMILGLCIAAGVVCIVGLLRVLFLAVYQFQQEKGR